MPDDPKAGTAAGEGGEGGKPTGTPPAAGSEAGEGKGAETAEQKVARLEAERDAAKKEADDQKALGLGWKDKAEKYNELERAAAARQAEQRTAEQGPVQAQIQRLEQWIAQYPDDEVAKAGLLTLKATVALAQGTQHQRTVDESWQQVPAEHRAKAREYWDSGDYRTPVAAHKAMLGDLSRGEIDKLSKEKEELEKDKRAREADGRFATGGTGGGSHGRGRRMKMSEYDSAIRKGGQDAVKLRQEADAGLIDVVKD